MKRIAILLSGRGSNFEALADAVEKGEIPAQIALVFSDRPQAPGLESARRRGLAADSIPPNKQEAREDYDRRVAERIDQADAELICLAGYMRILSPWFVRRYPMRILNIHPSLLPAFPGLKAQRQALEWGAQVAGCTVHFVDEEVDHGPIVLQFPVPVLPEDNEQSLAQRILEHEHQIYPQAVKMICQGSYRVEGRRVLPLSRPQNES